MFTNRTQCILRLSILLSLIWLTACANVTSKSSSFDVFDYVNQLIGTDNGGEQAIGVKVFLRSRQTANLGLGNVFAGASLPYGTTLVTSILHRGMRTDGFPPQGWPRPSRTSMARIPVDSQRTAQTLQASVRCMIVGRVPYVVIIDGFSPLYGQADQKNY